MSDHRAEAGKIFWQDINGREIYYDDIVEVRTPAHQVQKYILRGVVHYRFASHCIDVTEVIKWEGFHDDTNPPKTIWFLNLGNSEIEVTDTEGTSHE